MEKEVVSIMIPCYNGAPFLHRLFDSVLKQTYKKLQILFADDGSQDRTKDIVEWYLPQFLQAGVEFKYFYQNNAGLASAINLVLPHVSGEYCMWFDVDDMMSVDHIEKKANFLKMHPDCDVVMCKGYIYDEKDLSRPIGILGGEKATSTLFEDLLYERRRCTQGLYMVRTSALMEVLPDKHIYDENRRMGQNMQLLLPVTLQCNVGYTEDKLFQYVVRSDSLSHAHRKETKAAVEYIEHIQDIKKHVLSTLPITGNYMHFLNHKLDLFLCMQRINLLCGEEEIDEEYIKATVLEYIGYTDIIAHQKQRDIVYWGKCEFTEKIAYYLKIYAGIQGNLFIDSNPQKCNNKNILLKSQINREKMYLIIPLEYHEDIIESLMEHDFKNHLDFFYPKIDMREEFAGQKMKCKTAIENEG